MDLAPELLLLIVALGIAGHVLLFTLHRMAHPVVLLLVLFAVLSLLSTATLVPGLELLKWARLYVTVLAVGIAVWCVRPSLLGAGSWAMLGFAALYVAAALWSDAAWHGVMFKGLFLVTLMLGIMAVLVARDMDRLWTFSRAMALAAAAVTGTVALGAAAMPGAMLEGTFEAGGRLSVLGLNPNRIAETLAPLLVFCAFGLLYDPVKSWRVLCYLIALPALAVLLATGSRAGFGQVVIGFTVLALPLLRRPAVFAGVMAILGVGALIALGIVEQRRAVTLGGYDLAARAAPWGPALETFAANPLLGIGWAHRTTDHGYGSANLLSIYLQVLVEMGIVGLIVLLAALGRVAWSGLAVLRATAAEPTMRPFVYLAGALLIAVAGHGLAESGALMGSTLNAACLGIGAALFDWLLATVRARQAWHVAVHHAHAPHAAAPQPH